VKEKLWEEMPEGRKKDQMVKQAVLPFYLQFKVGKVNMINRLHISESVQAGRPTSAVNRFSNILIVDTSFEWHMLQAEKGFISRGVRIDFTNKG